jgi:hypothetical protein
MTAQFNDVFLHHNRKYALAGISEGELFDVALLGLKPVASCSACWRGYVAEFGLADNRLVLATLHVNLKTRPGPLANGVAPRTSEDKHPIFDNHYEGLDYHLEYSGGLLLADGFIDKLYVHMGFHPAWKYQRVHELVFDAGILKAEFDRSERMAEVRKAIEAMPKDNSGGMPSRNEIATFIDRAFDRSYRM